MKQIECVIASPMEDEAVGVKGKMDLFGGGEVILRAVQFGCHDSFFDITGFGGFGSIIISFLNFSGMVPIYFRNVLAALPFLLQAVNASTL